MKLKTMITRLTGAGLFAALLALVVVQSAQAEPDRRAKRRSAGFDLRAASTWNMATNRVACGLDSQGNVCTDVTGSPTGGGGFWPGGPPMQYIFNSGLQIAGIIAQDAPIWAGDTVGAFFFDASGLRPSGQQVTDIWSSVNPDDLANWPNGAYVRDGSLYDAALLGRAAVSQEDTWVRYWDGPSLLSGRQHPMGILVEQRGLAWNYPAGNEDIIYFMYTFTNISASDPAAYGGLDPAVRDEIAALGAEWVADVEDRLGIDLPAQGYRMDSLFGAFAMDPDVGNASENSSTAILPFQMGIAYKNDFNEPTWLYPPDINGPPFGPYPGFIGVKYLKSPIDAATGEQVGLTMFSNTTNGGTFPDPNTTSRLWRYLAGEVRIEEGDATCDINPPRERRLCALRQAPVDTRFFQASGPLSLGPGEQGTIVVAYVHAAPIAAEVLPYFNGVLPPGIPPNGEQIFQDNSQLRVLERAAGWVSEADFDGDLQIDQEEVNSVEYSLLWKAMVAQSLFDAQFLLPFAPESPPFFLVPGDNQVTVVWSPSITETIGDPYYDIANDPTSPLTDANYRFNDVEGYRIYRGRSAAEMELIAQYDYAGTTFDDYRGLWAYIGLCAPELGILDDCPANFPLTPGVDDPVQHALVDAPFVAIEMIKPGGRVELADGSIFVTETFNPVQDAGYPTLDDTGVPFAYVDNAVVNSTGYLYAVTAFDVNSIASGPGTLESARATQAVTPRAPSGQVVPGALQAIELVGADGTVLDPTAPMPTLDPATGMFSGPMPPTNGLDVFVASFLGGVVSDGALTVTIDDITPGDNNHHVPHTYHLTLGSNSFTLPVEQQYGGCDVVTVQTPVPAIPIDPDKAELYGGGEGFALSGTVSLEVPGQIATGTWARGHWYCDNYTPYAGPRWWAGADNENVEEPVGGFCGPAGSWCGVSYFAPSINQTAGQLPGVDVLWTPRSYSTLPYYYRNVESVFSGVFRAADIKVYWGAGGAIDSVIDVTHHVPVPFKATVGPSWGILNVTGFAGTDEATTSDGDNALLSWQDAECIGPVPELTGECGSSGQTPAVLEQVAVLNPISTEQSGRGDTMTQTGVGFIFYLNGGNYLMQMTALPAEGTMWNYRSHSGGVDGSPDGDDYAFQPSVRPPAVPGLTARLSFTATAFDAGVTSDSVLDAVHTVPDPYYATSGYEITPTQKVINFVNLPAMAIIRIYSVSGVLVDVLQHNDPTGGGEETWNVRNRNNQFVASGVYFYHLETPDGNQKIGRFTVINASGLAVGQGNQ